MKEITKYVCEFCLTEHDDYNEALTCESKPEPINGSEIKIGDYIHFGTESGSEFGGRWCYSSANGYVIEKKGAALQDGSHVWFLIVETGQGMTKMIRGVFWVEEQGGWFSPAEYDLGFKYIPQNMTEQELAEASETEKEVDQQRQLEFEQE